MAVNRPHSSNEVHTKTIDIVCGKRRQDAAASATTLFDVHASTRPNRWQAFVHDLASQACKLVSCI